MMTRIPIILIFAMIVSGCGREKSPLKFSLENNGGSVTPIKVEPNQTDPAWSKIKKDLFETSCTKCHNPDTAQRKKRLDLTQKDLVVKNAEDILYRMTDAIDVGVDYMPPEGSAVKPEIIKEFKAWRSDVEFANLQKKLFEVSCLKCHDANQTRHSNLTSKDVVMEKFDEIVYKMTKAFDESNKPMPPVGKGMKVPDELIQELIDWNKLPPL